MKRIAIATVILLTTINSFAQESSFIDEEYNGLWQSLLGQDPLVDSVLMNSDRYRFQFIYTDIERDTSGESFIRTESYSTGQYFYPASTVKLPTAILTMEKLHKRGYSLDAVLKIHDDQYCGNMSYIEKLENRDIPMKEIIEELIVVSDNTYYNALYQFLTPKALNDSLKSRGINKTKIYRSFTGCEIPQNLFCNSLHLTDAALHRTYLQGSSRMELDEFSEAYTYDEAKLLGSKHEYRREIVPGPFDFNYNLEYSLDDLHATMLRLVVPEQFPEEERWNLSEEYRSFLMDCLQKAPSELKKEEFQDDKKYPDNLYKYIVKGNDDDSYKDIVTYSKIGISYGFVTETAYVVNPKTEREFVVTASIYVNENDTVNDGKYEYEDVARPFFAKLGQLLLDAK